MSGEEHPYFATSLKNLAKLKYHEAKCKEALDLMELARTIYMKVIGPNHAHTKSSVQGLETIREAFKNQESGALNEKCDLPDEIERATTDSERCVNKKGLINERKIELYRLCKGY